MTFDHGSQKNVRYVRPLNFVKKGCGIIYKQPSSVHDLKRNEGVKRNHADESKLELDSHCTITFQLIIVTEKLGFRICSSLCSIAGVVSTRIVVTMIIFVHSGL